MTVLTRKDALSILEQVDTPEQTILRIKAHWAQLSWQISAQDLADIVVELHLQSEKERLAVIAEVNAKLNKLIGELK